MQKTLLMIKPEGMADFREITIMLETKGLIICESMDIECQEDFLRKLYKDQSGGFWEVNKEYLVGKKCKLLMIQGEDAVSRLFELAGGHYNPENCHKDTIRYIFGKRKTYIGKNGRELFLNAVHRSSPENAEYEVALFKEYYKLQKKDEEK